MDALRKQTRRFDTVSASEAFPGWGSFPQLQWEIMLAGAPSYHGNGSTYSNVRPICLSKTNAADSA